MSLKWGVVAFATAALGLAGCSMEPPPTEENQQTVIDDQLKVMDQAKAVEQQVFEAKDKTDEAIDGQSR